MKKDENEWKNGRKTGKVCERRGVEEGKRTLLFLRSI
jgi:hypothetical protein